MSIQLMCSDLFCATPLGYLLKQKKKRKKPPVTSATVGTSIVYCSMPVDNITSEVKITNRF